VPPNRPLPGKHGRWLWILSGTAAQDGLGVPQVRRCLCTVDARLHSLRTEDARFLKNPTNQGDTMSADRFRAIFDHAAKDHGDEWDAVLAHLGLTRDDFDELLAGDFGDEVAAATAVGFMTGWFASSFSVPVGA
jgi:hypothetical protein